MVCVNWALRCRPSLGLLLTIAVGMLVFAALTYLGATQLEENDAFCASCHSEPESTYFQRTQANAAVDLASLHAHLRQTHPKRDNTRCIDCHAGPGFVGRTHALSIGARDAIKWFTGSAVQPAITTQPLDDANCLKCHADIPATSSFDQHFHRYLVKWQQQDAAAGHCITCHTSHTIDGNVSIGFLQQQRTRQTCDACHKSLNVR